MIRTRPYHCIMLHYITGTSSLKIVIF